MKSLITDNDIIRDWENEIHLAEYVDSDYCSNIEVSLIRKTIDELNRLRAEIDTLNIQLSTAYEYICILRER